MRKIGKGIFLYEEEYEFTLVRNNIGEDKKTKQMSYETEMGRN